MRIAASEALSDRTIWLLVGSVFVCVLIVLIIVFKHDKEKPKSPQALVAAGFNQMFPVGEWKPGMGKKPFIYHPAALDRPVWRPLPLREAQPWSHQVPGGYPYSTPWNQVGGQP